MKAKVQFIGSLAMINAYLIAFAYGFNSKPVLVIDESLPPLPKPAAAPAKKSETKAAEETAAKETTGKETADKEKQSRSKSKSKSGSGSKSKSKSKTKSKTKKS